MARKKQLEEMYASKEITAPLHLAQFDIEKTGTLDLLHNNKKEDLRLAGEIVVRGQPDGEKLSLEQIQRFVLLSEPLQELGGPLSLAVLPDLKGFKPGLNGDIPKVRVQIYYPKLGELKPACIDNDAFYPQKELLTGRLTWRETAPPEDNALGLSFTLDLDKLIITADEGRQVQKFAFTSPALSFRAPTYSKDEAAKSNSLTPCDTSPAPPPTSPTPSDPCPSPGHIARKLNLRFYAMGLPNETPAQKKALEEKVQPWINKAGVVWCQKGGIKLVPYGDIDSLIDIPANRPSSKSGQSCPGTNLTTQSCPGQPNPGQKCNGQPSLSQDCPGHHPGGLDTSRVEIYLTTGKLDLTETGGGATFKCGTNDAYIILDFGAAQQNELLLAHELGHVLDLAHPKGNTCADLRKGSACSVMAPIKNLGEVNSERNTERNIGIIENTALHLQAPVFEPDGCCSWIVDEEVIGPIFNYVWNSNQQLSNNYRDDTNRIYANNKPVFGSNTGLPNSTTPVERGNAVQRHMYVNLSDCQLSSKPIKVHFYLADQNAAKVWELPTRFFDIPENERSDATLLRTLKTRSVPWAVPQDCPQQCWIYAVAVDKFGPTQDIQKIIDPQTQPTLRYDTLRNLFNQQDIHVMRADLAIKPFGT